MGEWKAQLSLRVRQTLRAEMEEFAGRERRKLGNVGEVLLEWGVEQLKAAGSLERLLKYKIRPSKFEIGNSRRKRDQQKRANLKIRPYRGEGGAGCGEPQ